MEILRSAINSSLSEETISQSLYQKTSLKPKRYEKKVKSEFLETGLCNCGERPVTLHCKTDDILLCKQCKHKSHVKCKVERIEQIAKGILESKNLQNTLKELNTLKYVFEKLKENRRLKKLQHRQEKRSLLQLTKKWKMLQSTRLALNNQVGKEIDRHQNDLDYSEKCLGKQSHWVAEEIADYLKDLNYHVTNKNELGTFETLHKVTKDLKTFYDVLNELSEHERSEDIYDELKTIVSGIFYCENQGNVTLARNLKQSKVSLPALTLNDNNHKGISVTKESPVISTPSRRSKMQSASRRFKPLFRPQTIRMATFASSLRSGRSSRALNKTTTNLKKLITDERPKLFNMGSSERDTVEVSAMCPLPSGEMIIIDNKNDKLKLFSTVNVLLTEINAGCSMWDLATISKYQIIVICPSEGKLQHVDIFGKKHGRELAKSGYILTQKDCRAICYVNGRIYVSYSGISPCIKVMSKDGIMCRSIEPFNGQTILFKNPLHMVVTKLGKLIYVSDFSLQRVAKIDQKGKLHGTIDVSPDWPVGLVVTRDNKLIVASRGSNDVKIIHRWDKKCETLVKSDWLKGTPSAVTVKEMKNSKQLYVACAESSVLNVFSMN